MAAQGPLRRWKHFLPAFASIDAAIEAVDPGISRVEFRDARLNILEMLCDATDGAVGEQICVVLDEVMIESLLTLEMVPAMPKRLASTDLAKDVGALRKNESERVRSLATGIVRGWRASVKDDLAKAVAAMEKLAQVLEPDETNHQAKILEPSAPKKTAKTSEPSFRKKQSAPVVGGSRVTTAKVDPPPEKAPAAVGSFRVESVWSCHTDEKAMNATKRKLQQGYQEAEDAKRQVRVQVIEAPDRQRKMQPITTRPRNRSCRATSTDKSTSRWSSFRRV
ncbi:hypothetical protein E2562_029954 [Oryza meyeriana var. granulata]|uniref:TFIIS N-terminal domain-containing protein n=1 Tax=Oryza meyeriana var. granulata TaxID=110450 RepID=A0A6G1CT97_9ORYZ|nr:hypothetical protein E2562_029954 [Oryza meyeriana var. granulata]